MSHFLRYPPLLASRRDGLVLSGAAPDGVVGDSYSYSGYRIAGGKPPYTITLDSGALPPIVTFSPAVTTGPESGSWSISGTLEEP